MKNIEPTVRIARISELPRLTHIHSLALMRFHGEPVGVTLRSEYSADPDVADMLILRLQACYNVLHNQIVRPLCEYAIEVTFDVEDTGLDLMSDEILLPQWLVALTLSVGIGAMRGMLSMATKNTFLTHYPLPLFDLDSLIASIDHDGDGGNGKLPEIRVDDIGPSADEAS